MSKKHVIALALVVGILMGLIVGMFFKPFAKLSVYGVSQINLIKQDVGGGKYELIWRVFGDTSYMNISAVKFNQTIVQAVNPSALPNGVSIRANIIFRVWQSSNYPPYWEVPFKKVNTNPILVVPKTFGVKAYFDKYNLYYKPILDKYTEPLKVDVYTLDWSNARLHIPFLFQAAKAGVGFLVPDKYTKQLGFTYLLDITPEQLTLNQNVTADITLTNPNDQSEWMKMHICFPITMPQYIKQPFSDVGFLTIQPPNGGVPVDPSNTFIGKETDVTGGTLFYIFNGWQSGNYHPWAYYWYWFGDPSGNSESKFKGNAIVWIHAFDKAKCFYGNFGRWGTDMGEANGTTDALIPGANEMWWPLSEGQMIDDINGAGPKSQVFDYPGWYRNFSEQDAWSTLYPVQPQLYYSYPEVDDPLKEPKYGTKPGGLSLCDYIRAEQVPVPQQATLSNGNYTSSFSLSSNKPSVKSIGCLNPYNPGLYAGGVPGVTNFVANLPLAGATWVVYVDISSELADAIVITQNYLDVRIQNFRISSNEIQPGSSVTLTMDLVNTLSISGYINLEIMCKEDIQYQVSGTGPIDFSANEIKKDYRVYVYNTLSQTISQKITGHFTLAVWNGEKYTSSVNFSLTFYPGAQLPNTGISVRCVNKNNPSEGIESVSITVFWGTSKERVARGVTTKGGYASIPLEEPFEGKVDIFVTDNYLRFYPANLTDQYVSPTKKNEFTIEMTPIGKGGFDLIEWLKQNMPYIIGGSIGAIGIAIGAYAVKRRREVIY
jgi:hypothetical protein